MPIKFFHRRLSLNTAQNHHLPGSIDLNSMTLGDRLRLTLSTTDNGYFGSREAAGIALSHGADDRAELSVPLVTDVGNPFEPVVATPGSVG